MYAANLSFEITQSKLFLFVLNKITVFYNFLDEGF